MPEAYALLALYCVAALIAGELVLRFIFWLLSK